MEILEVIRRWQLGESRRQIASGTGLSKDTVGKYISAAEGLGVSLDGASLDEEQLSQLAAISRSGPRQPEAPTEGKLAPMGRTDLPVADREPVAVDTHPGVAVGQGLLGFIRLSAAFRPAPKVASAQFRHRSHGGQPS